MTSILKSYLKCAIELAISQLQMFQGRREEVGGRRAKGGRGQESHEAREEAEAVIMAEVCKARAVEAAVKHELKRFNHDFT